MPKCIRIQRWRIYWIILLEFAAECKNQFLIHGERESIQKNKNKKQKSHTWQKCKFLSLKSGDPYGHGLLVLIHHIQHWVFGASSVVGTHQSTLATKNVDRITQGCSHETETLRWDAATFVPSVALYIIHLQNKVCIDTAVW